VLAKVLMFGVLLHFKLNGCFLRCHVLCVPDPLDLCSRFFFIILSENEKSAQHHP